MQQVLYIHGGESFTEYDAYIKRLKNKEIRNLPTIEELVLWTKTFEEQLGESFTLFTPKMPNSDNAKYEEWKIWFERHFQHLEDGIILLGWSLGAMFLTKYLSENRLPVRVSATILLAPAFYFFIDPETGEDGGDFNCDANKAAAIIGHTDKLVIFHSKDDTVIPFDHSLKLKEALPEAELITFEDRNHFLQAEFPELVAKIKEIARP